MAAASLSTASTNYWALRASGPRQIGPSAIGKPPDFPLLAQP